MNLDLRLASVYTNTTQNVTDVVYTSDTSLSEASSFVDYVEYQVARWVLLVYRPICASVGITGNVMCMVVVMTTSLRHSPTVVYVVTLAFLDWGISVFGAVTFLSKDVVFGEGRFFRETWHCKIFYFVELFIIHFDTLTMVFMTAQRYVAVGFPLHASRWVTKPTAVVSLVVAAVISALANVIHLIALEIQPYDGSYRGRCSVGTGLSRFIQIWVYPWIDFALYFLIPTVCISIFNVLILTTLRKAEKFKQNAVLTKSSARISSIQERQASGHLSRAQCSVVSTRVENNDNPLSPNFKATPDQVGHHSTDHFLHKTTKSLSTSTTDNSNAHSIGSSNNTGNSAATGVNNSAMLTRMLMMVSVAYLVLTLPMGVFVVISRFWNPPGGYGKARFSLIRDITESLMFTNHSINFLLYCLSGKRFRKKAARVLFHWCSASVSAKHASRSQ